MYTGGRKLGTSVQRRCVPGEYFFMKYIGMSSIYETKSRMGRGVKEENVKVS